MQSRISINRRINMYRCIDCAGPVEDHMIEAVTNPKTGVVDLELLLCEGCDIVNADGADLEIPSDLTESSEYGNYDGVSFDDEDSGYDY
jgi:hypothetical protein